VEVLYPRCAGLDVHKERVTACRRVANEGGKAKQDVRSFSTTTSGLLDLAEYSGEDR
jgi:transposase